MSKQKTKKKIKKKPQTSTSWFPNYFCDTTVSPVDQDQTFKAKFILSFTSLNLSFFIYKLAAMLFTSWVVQILKDKGDCQARSPSLPPYPADIILDSQDYLLSPKHMKIRAERVWREGRGPFYSGGSDFVGSCKFINDWDSDLISLE